MKILDTSYIYPFLMNIGDPSKLSDVDADRLEEIEAMINSKDEICMPESVVIEASNLLFSRIVKRKNPDSWKKFLYVKQQWKVLMDERKISVIDILNSELIEEWFNNCEEKQTDLNDFAINNSSMDPLTFDNDIE